MRNDTPDPAATPGRPALERNALLLRRPPLPADAALSAPRGRLAVIAGGLLLLVGLAAPASAAWMIPPAPYRAKDFGMVKKDGWYHIFYIRRDNSVPYDSTERDLGHAISRDLFTWYQLPAVLPVRPDYWDNAKVWAPDIHLIDGVYYMFYTGVTQQPGAWLSHQRIGLATSTDLLNWNRLDEPILSCAQVPWTFCDPLQYTGGEFRDAFVMPEPSGSGWRMIYTARPASEPGYVAGMATSAGDVTQWTGGDPLWITHSNYSGSTLVESPHMFEHNGLYYLIFTGNGAQPLRLATGPDPAGEAPTWTYRGPLAPMFSLDTAQWYASEYFVDGTHEYFCFVHYDRVDIREIKWGADWQFTLQQPSMFHVQSLTWNPIQACEGDSVLLRIEAVNVFAKSVFLEAFEVDADGSQEPIPLAAIGLPDSIRMTSNLTDYWWTARSWPDPEEADMSAEIVVQLTDRTAVSAPIRVGPKVWPGSDDGPPEAIGVYGRRQAGFRTLRQSPLGDLALLVDLAEPATVRLEIFDLAGRRVRGLANRALPSGATVIPWDGREENGARARPGIYFARLASPGFARTVRVLVSP